MSPPTIDNSQVSGWGGIRFAAGNLVANMDVVDISCCSFGDSDSTLSDNFQQVRWCYNYLSAISVHLLMGFAGFPFHPFGRVVSSIAQFTHLVHKRGLFQIACTPNKLEYKGGTIIGAGHGYLCLFL